MKKIVIIFLFLHWFVNLLQLEIYVEEKLDYSLKIDLFEKQLEVHQNNKLLKRYPIAIGSDLSPSTPIGTYIITEKAKSWGGGLDQDG